MVATEKGDPGFPVPRTIFSVWLGTLVPLPIYYDNTATDVTWLHNTPNFVRLAIGKAGKTEGIGGFRGWNPLGEGVVSNEVRGRGILPPFII